MTDVCSDCLFAENVENAYYMTCQARRGLIMPFDQVCDLFKPKRHVCEECTLTMELNGVNEYLKDLQDEYTNATCDCGYCKGTKFNKEAMLDDTNCNANSYSKLVEEEDEVLEELIDDLKDSYLGILETASALGEGGKPKDVLRELIGMEISIGLFKRYLLELDE